MAALQALSIVELLECVLEHADMQTLLLSQRVSRMFRDTITSSSILRRRLWLEPGEGAYFRDEYLRTFSSRPRTNPLLELDFAMFSFDVRSREYGALGRPERLPHNGPIVLMNCRHEPIPLRGGADPASWRNMLVLSQHEPDFQYQIWTGDASTKRPKCQATIYFQTAPKAGTFADFAREPPGFFMVTKNGKRLQPTDKNEVEQILHTWHANSKLTEPNSTPFTLLSRAMSVTR